MKKGFIGPGKLRHRKDGPLKFKTCHKRNEKKKETGVRRRGQSGKGNRGQNGHGPGGGEAAECTEKTGVMTRAELKDSRKLSLRPASAVNFLGKGTLGQRDEEMLEGKRGKKGGDFWG